MSPWIVASVLLGCFFLAAWRWQANRQLVLELRAERDKLIVGMEELRGRLDGCLKANARRRDIRRKRFEKVVKPQRERWRRMKAQLAKACLAIAHLEAIEEDAARAADKLDEQMRATQAAMDAQLEALQAGPTTETAQSCPNCDKKRVEWLGTDWHALAHSRRRCNGCDCLWRADVECGAGSGHD